MKFKFDVRTLLLLIAAGMCAYALPMELALIMAVDVVTYVEVFVAVCLIARTSPGGQAWALVKRWSRNGYERFQLWLGEGLMRNVPAFLPPHA